MLGKSKFARSSVVPMLPFVRPGESLSTLLQVDRKAYYEINAKMLLLFIVYCLLKIDDWPNRRPNHKYLDLLLIPYDK